MGGSLFGDGQALAVDLSEIDRERLLEMLPLRWPERKIILHLDGKLDRRSRLYKYLLKEARVLERNRFSPWRPGEIETWVRSLGYPLETDAARRLVEVYANDTATILSELERLRCYAGMETKIRTSHVESLCASRASIFELSKALIAGKLGQVSRDLRDLAPLPTLAAMQTVVRGYLLVASLQEKHLSIEEIASELGKHPKRVEDESNFIRGSGARSAYLRRIASTLNRAEEEIKTGRCSDPSLHMRQRIMSLLKST
jgi:DNA polymerase III delta subunit